MTSRSWALVALLVGVLTGCSGTLGASRAASPKRPSADVGAVVQSARCQDLDDRRSTWGAIAQGTAVFGGATGLVAIPVESHDAVVGLAITGVVAGAVSAFSVAISESAGDAWVRECLEGS